MLGIEFGNFAASGGGSASQTWPTWDGTLDGSPVQFEPGSATAVANITSCLITADTTFIAYKYNSILKCVIVTTSGKIVTAGTAITVASINPSAITCATVDSTHVMLCYGDNTNNKTRAVCISISGTTPTANAIIDVDAANVSGSSSVVLLNTNRCVLAYNSTGSPQAVCLTLSGTTVTKQTDFAFTSDNLASVALSTLTSSTIAAVWTKQSTNTANTVILSVSTNTITAPTAQSTLSSVWDSVSPITCVALDSTHYIAALVEQTSTNGIAYCSSVSGTTITVGSKATFDSGGSITLSDTGPSIAAIDAATALVTYKVTNAYGVVMTISGTTITAYTRVNIMTSTGTNQRSIVTLDTNRVIAALGDASSPSAGVAEVLSIV